MHPDYWQSAITELSERDPVMAGFINAYPSIKLKSRGDAFSTLARSIVGQQISVKAAESVWQRVLTAVGPAVPNSFFSAEPTLLRSCGLSGRKVEYLQDLARRFVTGELDVSEWGSRDDEELIIDLSKVKGIGRWTAEMFLIFYLMRPNILPLDDIGLQRAMSLHYNDKQPLTKQAMRDIAKHWQPWCSVATWYMWRSLDPIPVEY